MSASLKVVGYRSSHFRGIGRWFNCSMGGGVVDSGDFGVVL